VTVNPVVVPVFIAGFLLASTSAAQQSRCADCHFAQPAAPAREHLLTWDRSPHGRSSVGCEKCHGGDSTVFEPALAHRGILNPRDRTSPVNRVNLPATCGACHVGPFAAFQDSRHYVLLREGNPAGPTCSTCHDSVDGRLLSAKGLEARCNSCHGPNEVAPRAERARKARNLYEALGAIRQEAKLAQGMIRKVDDKQRRAELLDMYEQAQVPLARAVNAGHKFVYADLETYLSVAQDRIEKLITTIVNRARR